MAKAVQQTVAGEPLSVRAYVVDQKQAAPFSLKSW